MWWTTMMLALGAASMETSRAPARDPAYACFQFHYLADGDKLRIERDVGAGARRTLFGQWYMHEGRTGTWVFVSWDDRTGALTPPGGNARVSITYRYFQEEGFTRGRLELHRPPRPDGRGSLVLRGRLADRVQDLRVRLRLGRFLAFARGADVLTLRVVGADGRTLAEDGLDPAFLARAEAAVAAARPGWDRMIRARATDNRWARCQPIVGRSETGL
jgi:hypothetical protein